MGDGAFGPPPVGGPAPTYHLQEQKWQKSAIFGFLYFCPLTPQPLPYPTPPQ